MRGREREREWGNGGIEFITPSVISQGNAQPSITGTQDGGQGGLDPPSYLSDAKAGVEGSCSDFSVLHVSNHALQIPQGSRQGSGHL